MRRAERGLDRVEGFLPAGVGGVGFVGKNVGKTRVVAGFEGLANLFELLREGDQPVGEGLLIESDLFEIDTQKQGELFDALTRPAPRAETDSQPFERLGGPVVLQMLDRLTAERFGLEEKLSRFVDDLAGDFVGFGRFDVDDATFERLRAEIFERISLRAHAVDHQTDDQPIVVSDARKKLADGANAELLGFDGLVIDGNAHVGFIGTSSRFA